MHLKISDNKSLTHKELATCVGWVTGEEVWSCGDDRQLMRWNVETEDGGIVTELGEGAHPTEMQWLPRSDGGRGRTSEVLALGTAEGKVWLLARNGRVEKTVESHVGAVLCVKWSWDGGALLTGGEDGVVKIWSRSGMLRSSLAQNQVPVYSGAWGPNNDQVVYSCGKQLVIKSLQANVKPTFWKAHDAVILKVDWSPCHGLIVSGGEDCRYKVWSGYGILLFSSGGHDYPITALSWAPDGASFAVGGFDLLRLCDKNGWSHSLERPARTGSVMSIAWSADSTQLAAACGSGRLLLAHVGGTELLWGHYTAKLTQDRCVSVHNAIDGSRETLEVRDRVVKLSFRHGHLVVATCSSCYIYSIKNWNTPVVIDLKEMRATLVVQSVKSLLLVDGSQLLVYSYEGRLLADCSRSLPTSTRPETLHPASAALSPDCLAVLAQGGSSLLLVELPAAGPAVSVPIPGSPGAAVLLDQSPARGLALLDGAGDLWLYEVMHVLTAVAVSVRASTAKSVAARQQQGPTGAVQRRRLTGQVGSAVWHEKAPILAASGSSPAACITLWPRLPLPPRLQLPLTAAASTGGSAPPAILQFGEGRLLMRRAQDGSLVTSFVPPYVELLDRLLVAGKWSEAVSLCRSTNVESLWQVLAATATRNKDLDTAQMAYAALNDVDRVEYLERARQLQSAPARQAAVLLAGLADCGGGSSGSKALLAEAESLLLSQGHAGSAVMLQLRLYGWERALELAADSDRLVGLVRAHRARFLTRMGRHETLKGFLAGDDHQNVPEWEDVTRTVESIERGEKI